MNILLWVLQILLALHTIVGAVWKFSNSEQAVPSLNVLPNGVWRVMSVLEILFGIGLVIPAILPLGILVPISALFIVAEMLLFCGLHLRSRATDYGPMIYWLVVAAISAFIAYGRFVLLPL